MALSIIWVSFILIAFLLACYQYVWLGNHHIFERLVSDLFDNATLAVMKISLPLVGIMAFWLGIMKIAERAGLVSVFSRWLHPLVSSLFPQVPRNHPVVGQMMMNFSANMLGLDNAATPFGLKAMQSLQEINPIKSRASNEQIMFLLLHASGLTLIPVSVMAQRSIYGAMNPSDIFIPIAISTTFTTIVTIFLTSIWQRLRFNWRFLLILSIFIGCIIGGSAVLYAYTMWKEQAALSVVESLPSISELVGWTRAQWEQSFPSIVQWHTASTYPLQQEQVNAFLNYYISEQKNQFNLLISNVILLLIPIGFILYALRKRRNVFEDFVEGAKESFPISLKIIPYLVGLLVAIGLLRSSGAIDIFVSGLQSVADWIGIDDTFVPSLSTALMKPLSGSGARAMMVETMEVYGADSFVGRLSCIFQGTSDTLLYVVALYFGSVGIRSTRYIVPLGLLIDFIGIAGAIVVGYWFFT